MTSEPQSIVHQVLRLEQKLVKAFTSIAQRRRHSRRAQQKTNDVSEDFTETTCQDSTILSAHLCFSESSSHTSISNSSCQTLDQNEFLTEVMNNEPSELVFVHLFMENSQVSQAIDKRMEKLKLIHGKSRFVRVDISTIPFLTSSTTPYLTSCLLDGVDGDRPSVLAMKNGKLSNMISDFSAADCTELDDWMYTVELLQMFKK